MTPVEVIEGSCPVILAMPHSGTFVPADIKNMLNELGQGLSDTDWHIPRLYDGLLPEASIVRANFNRYVIDANRDAEDTHLYPGQNTTGLCPLTNFDGLPIWRDGCEPDSLAVEERLHRFHAPYHRALRRRIEEVKAQFGYAILYDCHSIRSRIPYLFQGTLPTLNIGTHGGASCDPRIERLAEEVCAASPFSQVLNGRFRGGWTTRHYGNPAENIHAIQMEITQSAYMEEQAPWTYLPERAGRLRESLAELLSKLTGLEL